MVPHRMATPVRPLVSLARASDPGAAAPTDEELVQRALAGDKWAESVIYRRYASGIANLAMRLTGHRADAMDIVQDVFAEALLDLHRLREPAALRGWLRRRAVNKAHRRFRRRKLRRMLGLERDDAELTFDRLASAGCSPEDRLELRDLSRVLSTLPTRQRVSWLLHRVEGDSLGEVADAVGRSVATVKRDVAAAQRAIEKAMRSER